MGTLDNATEMLSWNKEGKYFLELSDQKKNVHPYSLVMDRVLGVPLFGEMGF